jgi:hypothetical protein
MSELLENKRIDQLPLGVPAEGDFYPYRDMVSGITKRAAVPITSTSSQNFEWIPDNDYLEDEVVTRGGLWFQAQVDNNNVVPGTNPAIWLEINKSQSGFVIYAPGVFSEDEVFVIGTLHNKKHIFRLTSVTRPYVSANLLLEYGNGDWELASEAGYLAVEKVAHGFTTNKVITFKAGNWALFTDGDQALGIVVNVPDADTFILYLIAKNEITVSGATAGTIYYAQADGSIGTTATDVPLYIAVSTTRAVTLAAQGNGGGGDIPAPAALIGLYNFNTTITAPPGNGQVRFNNATQNSATQLFIDHLTSAGADVEILLENLKTGDIIIIQRKNDASQYKKFTITATPTDNDVDTYISIPVSLAVSGGTDFAGGNDLFVAVFPVSGGGGTSTNRFNFFRFNSDLFTEQQQSFRGVINTLTGVATNGLSGVSFEVQLDTASTWTAIADLTALQTWINSNVTGTEASGTLYWIKVLATYSGTNVGIEEYRLGYSAT